VFLGCAIWGRHAAGPRVGFPGLLAVGCVDEQAACRCLHLRRSVKYCLVYCLLARSTVTAAMSTIGSWGTLVRP